MNKSDFEELELKAKNKHIDILDVLQRALFFACADPSVAFTVKSRNNSLIAKFFMSELF